MIEAVSKLFAEEGKIEELISVFSEMADTTPPKKKKGIHLVRNVPGLKQSCYPVCLGTMGDQGALMPIALRSISSELCTEWWNAWQRSQKCIFVIG